MSWNGCRQAVKTQDIQNRSSLDVTIQLQYRTLSFVPSRECFISGVSRVVPGKLSSHNLKLFHLIVAQVSPISSFSCQAQLQGEIIQVTTTKIATMRSTDGLEKV